MTDPSITVTSFFGALRVRASSNRLRVALVLPMALACSVSGNAAEVCDAEARAAQTAGCSQLQERHEPSGLNSSFSHPLDLPFASYLEKTGETIRQARARQSHRHDEEAVNASSPFQWEPDPQRCAQGAATNVRGSVLLIHGLTDSPFLMRDVGRHFQQRCYRVRTVVLPGHGTVPGDLLGIDRREWIKAVRYGIDSFDGHPRPLIVVGFSTGAAAALHTQLERSGARAVDGLVLLSPALEPKSRWSFLANWHRARAFFKTPEEYAPKRWLEVATDEDYAKYESFTKDAGDQIHELSKEVRRIGCGRLDVPVFMAVSRDDETVKASSAIECFEDIPGAGTAPPGSDSRLLVYGNDLDATHTDARTTHHVSAHAGHQIIDFAHTAIPVAPDNEHYGRTGDYKSCMHYLGHKTLWGLCKSGSPDVMLGETSEENLDRHTMRRLTFNPYFDDMVQRIDRFLDVVERSAGAGRG